MVIDVVRNSLFYNSLLMQVLPIPLWARFRAQSAALLFGPLILSLLPVKLLWKMPKRQPLERCATVMFIVFSRSDVLHNSQMIDESINTDIAEVCWRAGMLGHHF